LTDDKNNDGDDDGKNDDDNDNNSDKNNDNNGNGRGIISRFSSEISSWFRTQNTPFWQAFLQTVFFDNIST